MIFEAILYNQRKKKEIINNRRDKRLNKNKQIDINGVKIRKIEKNRTEWNRIQNKRIELLHNRIMMEREQTKNKKLEEEILRKKRTN